MNTKEVWFLYKQGLINPQLIMKFELKHGDLARVHEQLKFVINYLIFINTMFIVTSVFMSFDWLYFGISFFSTLLPMGLLIWIIYIKYTLNYKQIIVNSFSKLNHYLYTYYNGSEFRKYHLHMDYDWLVGRANEILLESARVLAKSEFTHGVDDELTIRARRIFKNAHAIFVHFDLCNENQGDYIRAAQEATYDSLMSEPEVVNK